jgi:predicted protein tyrosine phosphatase
MPSARDARGRRHHVLFVCRMNRQRSATAERLFRSDARIDVRSAGVERGALVPVTEPMLRWADLVFVMEPSQRSALRRRFGALSFERPIVCLEIPDDYPFMHPELVRMLETRVPPYLDALA